MSDHTDPLDRKMRRLFMRHTNVKRLKCGHKAVYEHRMTGLCMSCAIKLKQLEKRTGCG